MKIIKTNLFILILLFVSTAVSFVSAQEKINKTKKHPYLFFTDERIKSVKEQMKNDTAMQASWQKMLKDADDVVAKKSWWRHRSVEFGVPYDGRQKIRRTSKTIA